MALDEIYCGAITFKTRNFPTNLSGGLEFVI